MDPKTLESVDQRLAKSVLRTLVVNTLSCVDHMVLVTATQFCHQNRRTTVDGTPENVSVPNKISHPTWQPHFGPLPPNRCSGL